MRQENVDTERRRNRESSCAELRRWKRRLDELPDARLEKVRTTRSALRRNDYDDERIMDETVRRLWAEISILRHLSDRAENRDAI